MVCGHFIREAEAVISELAPENVECAAYPARCGRPPVKLEEIVSVAERCGHALRVVVIGGCCLNQLASSLPRQSPVRIIHTEQCFEMVAGKTFIESQIKEGAFLATPGWLPGWRQWIDASGFDMATARNFFKESVSGIIMLDTCTDENAGQHLKEFAEFVDRPALTVPVGIDIFKLLLHREILLEKQGIAKKQAEEYNRRHQREQADFAMMLDLLHELPKATSEKEALEKTRSVFDMLFAPKSLTYTESDNGGYSQSWRLIGEIDEKSPSASGEQPRKALHQNIRKSSENGFTLRIASREGLDRVLGVQETAFPEYLERYVQIAQAVGDVCGLAIDNARSYEKLKKNENRLREMATTDSLTQVSNHRHFMEKAEFEVYRAARYNSKFSLIYLDIDNFKKINDTYGHPSGDQVLEDVAALCAHELRQNDLLGRIGGEEFAMGIIEADVNETREVAERIRQTIAGHQFEAGAARIQCTVSIGIAAYSGPEDDLTRMMRRADDQLYQAKRNGKNRIAPWKNRM